MSYYAHNIRITFINWNCILITTFPVYYFGFDLFDVSTTNQNKHFANFTQFKKQTVIWSVNLFYWQTILEKAYYIGNKFSDAQMFTFKSSTEFRCRKKCTMIILHLFLSVINIMHYKPKLMWFQLDLCW